MRLLLDTNVPMEVLLYQAGQCEARQVLVNRAGHDLHLSAFSLDSIGVVLMRRGLHQVFLDFVADMVESGRLTVVSIAPSSIGEVARVAVALSLDFDDAYQYVAAERHNLDIVSYDAHFDRTPRGRQTPAQVLTAHGPDC